MRSDEGRAKVPEQPKVEGGPAMILCRSCEEMVPADSLYCPYCCGVDGRRGAVKRGAFIGGVFGLLAGGLAAALWSSIVGPELATGEPVLTITLAGAAIGIVLGAVLNWKG